MLRLLGYNKLFYFLLVLGFLPMNSWAAKNNSAVRIARFFPQKSMLAVSVNNTSQFLNKLDQKAQKMSLPSLFRAFWKDTRREFHRKMGFPKNLRRWNDFLSRLGLAPHHGMGMAMMAGKYTPKILFVLETHSPKLTMALIEKIFARNMIREFSSHCQSSVRQYNQAIRKMRSHGHKPPFGQRKLRRYFPRLPDVKCSSPSRCIVDGFKCNPKESSYRLWQKWKALKKRGLPRHKIYHGWLIGDKRLGFSYALIRNKYIIFSNLPSMLNKSLQTYQSKNMKIARGFQKFSPRNSIYVYSSIRSLQKQLNFLSIHRLLRSRNKLLLSQFISNDRFGIRELWLSGRLHRKRWVMKGRLTSTGRGSMKGLLAEKSTHLQLLSNVPYAPSVVFSSNLLRASMRFVARIMRMMAQLPSMAMIRPIAMMVDSWSLVFGKEISFAVINHNRTFSSLLVIIKVSDTSMLKQQINDLQAMFGKKKKLFQTSNYKGTLIRYKTFKRRRYRRYGRSHRVNRPSKRNIKREVAFAIVKNYLVLTAREHIDKPLSFIKEIISITAKGQKFNHFPMQRVARKIGRMNTFFHISFPELLRQIKRLNSHPLYRRSIRLPRAFYQLHSLQFHSKNKKQNVYFGMKLRFK